MATAPELFIEEEAPAAEAETLTLADITVGLTDVTLTFVDFPGLSITKPSIPAAIEAAPPHLLRLLASEFVVAGRQRRASPVKDGQIGFVSPLFWIAV